MLVEGQILISRLEHWAETQPTKSAWSFVDTNGEILDSYTYEELNNSSTVLGNQLISTEGVKPGDRVLLVFFPGLEFTVSLLACFKVGIIAVPVFPPDPRKLKKDLHHFVSIQSSSGSTVCLTHGAYNFAKNMAGAKNLFSLSGNAWPDMKWIQVDKILSKNRKVTAKSQHSPMPSQLAFLQYTSGSTSEPKGVMISHENLAHNLLLITRELKTTQETVEVSWLPQYHDMGLIGSYLGCVYCGGSGYYLSPITFLKDPTCWPRVMSKYKATHTQAPNFAYALVVRKWRALKAAKSGHALDLSSIRHMINAAEPVDASAILDFYSVFAPYGLQANVVVPTYGLAEHCVFVCSGGRQMLTVRKDDLANDQVSVVQHEDAISTTAVSPSGAEGAEGHHQVLVGCGYPGKSQDVDVRIVDVETRVPLSVSSGSMSTVEGNRYGDINTQVGEIWVNSPSKAQGYWNLPQVTQDEFQARVVEATTAEPREGSDVQQGQSSSTYLRTGDLGFFYRGELFICGRLKDLIIVRGSNHYPQDIEKTAEAATSQLRPGCSAAFGIKCAEDTVTHDKLAQRAEQETFAGAHTEALVYVAELKPETVSEAKALGNSATKLYASIVEQIRGIISKEHGLGVSTVCLLEPRTVPKTTSGKITRKGCIRALASGTLSIVYRWDAPSGQADALVASLADVTVDMEGVSAQTSRAPKPRAGSTPITLPFQTPEELAALPFRRVQELIEALLIQVCDGSPAPQTAPVDPSLSLLDLGLDSMTIAQFKGALDSQFYTAGAKRECAVSTDASTGNASASGIIEPTETTAVLSHPSANKAGAGIPDDFMFTSLASLEAIALAAQRGGLTAEQRRRFEDALAGAADDDEDAAVLQKQPLCPWYTCCS